MGTFSKIFKFPISGLVLIAANIIPIVGVANKGWGMIDVIVLYWFESAIIGFYNILKMMTARRLTKKNEVDVSFFLGVIVKLLYCFCFAVIFGGFMFIHAILIFLIMSELTKTPFHIDLIRDYLSFMPESIFYGAVSLVLSHGYSFVTNYILGGERQGAIVSNLMSYPFSRVWVMQVSLLLGFAFATIFSQHIYLVIFFVVVKIIADFKYHLKERERFGPFSVSHRHPTQ